MAKNEVFLSVIKPSNELSFVDIEIFKYEEEVKEDVQEEPQ